MTPLDKFTTRVLDALRSKKYRDAEKAISDLAWAHSGPWSISFGLEGSAAASWKVDSSGTKSLHGTGPTIAEALTQVRAALEEQARARTDAASRIAALYRDHKGFVEAFERILNEKGGSKWFDLTIGEREQLRKQFPDRPEWAWP